MLERRRTHARRVACGIVATLALGWTAAARAQTTSDSAAAQELFEAAKKLVAQKDYRDACPKFAASQKLDPQPGTEFNLADCYEQVGQTASAWVAFNDVADVLHVRGDTARETVARGRANALAPKLVRLAINVPNDSRVPGLSIKRDGEALADAQWGLAVPVDPGAHTVEASAPNAQAWSSQIDVRGEGKTITIDVPKLSVGSGAGASAAPGGAASSASFEAAPGGEPGSVGNGQRTIGLVVGGVGVVAIGVGAFFGFSAISKNNDSSQSCVGDNCTQAGFDARNDALSAARVSTIMIGLGAAAVAGGLVLYFTAPKSTGVRAGLAPNGVFMTGSF